MKQIIVVKLLIHKHGNVNKGEEQTTLNRNNSCQVKQLLFVSQSLTSAFCIQTSVKSVKEEQGFTNKDNPCLLKIFQQLLKLISDNFEQ